MQVYTMDLNENFEIKKKTKYVIFIIFQISNLFYLNTKFTLRYY